MFVIDRDGSNGVATNALLGVMIGQATRQADDGVLRHGVGYAHLAAEQALNPSDPLYSCLSCSNLYL
jgi:hypothetical protein